MKNIPKLNVNDMFSELDVKTRFKIQNIWNSTKALQTTTFYKA